MITPQLCFITSTNSCLSISSFLPNYITSNNKCHTNPIKHLSIPICTSQPPTSKKPDIKPPDKSDKSSPTTTISKSKSSEIIIPSPRLSNLEVIVERFNDTILDARIHYTRLFTRKKKSKENCPHVVILGTGWAAHSLVKVIDTISTSATIISPRNFFFFTPLLSASAVGTVEFRSIVEPIRAANPFIDYFEAYAIDIDIENQQVKCIPGKREGKPDSEDSFNVSYDYLVVAVGETTATFGVPGAREYAYFLKEISDARRLRQKILELLEKAALPVWTDEERRNLLHFVVVGGGPTGCEFAGELSDFVQNDLSPRYGKELVSQIGVSLLQSGESLLTQFEESLQNVALKAFRGRVNVILRARAKEITEKKVILQSGEEISYGLLIWAAGNGTRPIVGKIYEKVFGENKDQAIKKRRKLHVDEWLRIVGTKNIFAVGDCAVIDGNALPATAQVAGQQGAFLGRLLSKSEVGSISDDDAPTLKDSGGKKIHPFRFLSLGIMAYIGNQQAIVQVDATSDTKVKLGGRVAYALWRSVYAVKQVDVRNRVLVLFDYFKSRVFGRDISQF